MTYDTYTPHQNDPLLGSPWETENGSEHVSPEDMERFAAPILGGPEVLWHVAPRWRRAQILNDGLIAPEEENAAGIRGVYLSDDPRSWMELHDGQDLDFWTVDCRGLILHHDPEMGINGDYVFLGSISPARLSLAD